MKKRMKLKKADPALVKKRDVYGYYMDAVKRFKIGKLYGPFTAGEAQTLYMGALALKQKLSRRKVGDNQFVVQIKEAK